MHWDYCQLGLLMEVDFELQLEQLPDAPVPVVLLGGLNLVRALGLAGIPAIVASPDATEPAFASRYCYAPYRLPPLGEEAAVLRALEWIGERLQRRFHTRPPLVYGNDDYLKFLYAHRERLEARFRFRLANTPIGEALLDKGRFAVLAQERGLPVPRNLVWEGNGPGTLAGADYPVLVKPKVKFDWDASPVLRALFSGEGKALVLQNGHFALQHPLVQHYREQLVFQQYIPGGDGQLWCFDGVADEDGKLLAGYVGRKLRTFPQLIGNSCYIELARDPALEAIVREVLARVPLKGVFNMDFKRDPRDGRYYLLEINARYNFWLYLGAKNGINLARVMYDYLLTGKRPASLSYNTTYRWLDFALDSDARRELSAGGELGVARWALSLLGTPKIYNVFSWDDPRPWAELWGARFQGRFRRGSKRLRQWLSKAS
jgi:predicted ATP-grasp superfamily ATP-dependent carboligase